MSVALLVFSADVSSFSTKSAGHGGLSNFGKEPSQLTGLEGFNQRLRPRKSRAIVVAYPHPPYFCPHSLIASMQTILPAFSSHDPGVGLEVAVVFVLVGLIVVVEVEVASHPGGAVYVGKDPSQLTGLQR